MRWPFRKAPGPPRPEPTLAPGRRIYAFGDVHGKAELLRALLKRVRADIVRRPIARTLLIGLGDYVDRGEGSAQVLDALCGASLPCDEHVFLRGNHEEVLLAATGEDDALTHWMEFGGRETVRSYGVPVPRSFSAAGTPERFRRDWLRAMPTSHLRFLRTTPLQHRDGGYVFVHAGVRPGRPLAQQLPHDLLWIREPFLSHTGFFDAVVVHGHTPRTAVENLPNRINVDTGAYATGRLTAVVLEANTRRFLSTADEEATEFAAR